MKNEHCDGKDFNFLIGKSIIKVEKQNVTDEYGYPVNGYVLTCDDNTIIEVELNEGCGGCNNGWSSFEDLKKLENNHNVITNVVCKYDIDTAKENGDFYKDIWLYDENYNFKLFIYYQDDMLTLEGDDGYGNGYYGGGFYVTIKEGTMKTAKEMFEELRFEYDYIQNKNSENTITYHKDNLHVQFNLISKLVVLTNDTSKMFYNRELFMINTDLLQAINKQIEELGWLDETSKK